METTLEKLKRNHASYMRVYWRKNKDELNRKRNQQRKDNHAFYRKQQNDWADKNRPRKLFTAAKTRAKQKGIEFSITLEDITPFPNICPALGIQLRNGISGSDDNSYSIDRIDNTKGYIPGNVAIISRRANRLKSDGTLEELKAIYDWVKSNQEVML